MQTLRWTPKTLWWVKEARQKTLHTVWFHLHEISRKGESTSVVSWGGVGWGGGGLEAGSHGKQAEGNFFRDGSFLKLDRGMVMQLFTKKHQTVHLQWMNFMVYKLYFIEIVWIKRFNFHVSSIWHSWSFPPPWHPVFTSYSVFSGFTQGLTLSPLPHLHHPRRSHSGLCF